MHENSINAWDRRAKKFLAGGWTGMLLQFCVCQTGHKANTNVSVNNSKKYQIPFGPAPRNKIFKISVYLLQNCNYNPHILLPAQRAAGLLGIPASLLLLSGSKA